MANLTNNGITGLWIDGKPVRRASLGGKVFFEKHDYNLSVVSDKDILSCADGDSATLTARLTDYGEPVVGETVLIYDSNKISKGTYGIYDTFILALNDEGSLILSAGGQYRVYNNSGDINSWVTTSSRKWTFVVSDGKLHIYESDDSHDFGNYEITNDLRLEVIPYEGSEPTLSFPTIFHIGTTDVNGECSVVYDSKGTGDLNIKCEAPDCSLVTEIYVETVDTSNPNRVVSDGYTAPIRFVGEIKRNGYWGGVRIYGTDVAHHYIFLSQNSYNDHEYEKIWYVLGSSWVSFEAIIKDGTVQLYINDNLIQSVNTDTTGTFNLWGGSNANPVSLRNLKVTNLIIS